MKLLFLGDFYYDYDYISDDIKSIAKFIKKNNYITILNLEGSLKTDNVAKKMVNLAFSDKFIQVLKMLNVKAVNLANNHIMDYGVEGLKLIINKLDDAGIGHFGAGLNLKEAYNTCNLKIDDKNIVFGGYGWNMEECINATEKKAGTAPLNFKTINNIIQNTNCDLFVPIFHYGYEFEPLPQPLHLLKTRELLKNETVKIIIGHHPHVVQAYEENIYYSLGNFYFSGKRDMFYNNKKHSKETSYGIGVVYDLSDNTKEIVEFLYNGKDSIIVENYNKLNNITKIKTNEYMKYFYKNNKFFNKKFVYKPGVFNEKYLNNVKYYLRNIYKYYLRNFKWPIIKGVKKLLKVNKMKDSDK